MGGLNIKVRIWLSIGIFVFGYLLSTIVGQLDRRNSEEYLGELHDVLVPADRSGGEAIDALERLIKAYADTFVVQDGSGCNAPAPKERWCGSA